MTTPGGFATPREQAAAMQRERQRYEQLKASLTASQAANIGALARENPSLSPGALYAAGRAGIAPGSPAAQAMGEADIKVKQEKGSLSFGSLVGKAYRGVKRGLDAVTPDAVEEFVKDDLYSGLKGVSRGAFGLAMAPGEAIQGAFRDAAADGDVNWQDLLQTQNRIASNLDTTSIGQVFGQVRRNGLDGVDTGNGFFIGGKAAEAQKANAIRQAPMQINGRTVGVTFGRYYANKLDLEPGGKAFNLVSGLADATIAVTTDPTIVASPLTKAAQARRLFSGDASRGFQRSLESGQAQRQIGADLQTDMGTVEGLRRTVNSDRVFEFLTQDGRGKKLVQYLADEVDFERAWTATKGKVDPKLLLELTARQRTPDEIINMLGPALGRTAGLDQKFGLDAVARLQLARSQGASAGLGTMATAAVKAKTRDVRAFGTVPERVLPKDDLPGAIRNMDNFLKNAKVSREDRSGIMARMAATNGHDEMFQVAVDAMALGTARAMADGIDPEKARKLFKIFSDSHSDRLKFWQGQVAGQSRLQNKAFGRPEDIRLLDDRTTAALPHLASQFLDQNIPLPDVREIRRALSPFAPILNNPKIQVPLMALEKLNDNIFKPGVLLRPAYILRNQIDEQFRPAGMGLNSMFNHPIQYISWLMHDLDGVGRVLGKFGVQTGRGAQDVTGESFNRIPELRVALRAAQRGGDEAVIARAQAALDAAALERASAKGTQAATEYLRTVSGGVGNWRNRTPAELKGSAEFQLSDGQYSQALAENLHLVATDPLAKRIANGNLFDGDGIGVQGVDGIREWWWSGAGKSFREDLARNNDRMKYLLDEAGANAYIDDTVTFVDDVVGQSLELRQAAATGGINRVPLFKADRPEVNPQAVALLDQMKNEPGFMGQKVIGGKVVEKGAADNEGFYTKAVDWIFYQIADRPTAYLSKSPAFRQRYYQRLENLIGFMDPVAQRRAIQGARDAKMKGSYIKRLEQKSKRSGSLNRGEVGFEQADLIAKTDAMTYVKDLFYNLDERGQFFDITRLLFPFGEAFKDSAVKYSQIVANNPVLPYRLGQGIQGGRDADADGDGEGFLYTDPQTGEEVFNWPGSGTMMEGLGVQGYSSPLKNLNILGTTVVPGFGPVVQIAASQLLPDEPDFDGMRELINPYGDRDISGGALESFLPAWFSKFRTAELIPFLDADPKQARAFMNAQKDVMGYLASTGDYDLSDPIDEQQLRDDARKRAQVVFFVRGMAQSILPAPPSPKFIAEDKDGKLLLQFKIAERYQEIQKEQRDAGTPEQTNRLFIEEFGPDALLAAVSNTKPGEDKSPVAPTPEGSDFYRNNRQAAQRFPTVFGLFGPPDDPTAEFDFPAYQRQLKDGERVVISPEEAVRRANQRLGSMVYQQAKDLAGPDPNPQAKRALKELKDQLTAKYPGYSSSFSNDTPQVLADLERAVQNRQLAKTPPGQGLKVWFEARKMAEDAAQQQFGTGWSRADKARGIRDAMRLLAEELGRQYPGFTEMYERALEREMVKDEPIAEPGAAA